jgi:outer membrane protein TolC
MTAPSPRTQRALTQANGRIKDLEAQLAASEADRLAIYAKLLALLSPIQEQPPAQLPQGFTPTPKPAPVPTPTTHNAPSVSDLLAEWEE